jgi:predicted membrane-bound spermidine synthase
MAALEGLLCLVGLGSMFYYNQLPRLNYDLFIKATGAFGSKGLFLGHITMAALVVLAPCLLMGALFPVTVRAVREFGPAASAPEANVGRLYVMNTFGGILGSLAAGFLMVPQIGVWKTLLAAALVSGVLALGALSLASQFPRIVQAAWAAALLAAVAGLAAAAPPLDVAYQSGTLSRDVYDAKAGPRPNASGTACLLQ